ncbi:hypothetical protein G3R47_04400 [Acinetobacter baumannii]|uniref:Bbp19 family protein n=1 Tax=Acinetobacter baumannii TaxID=470 RepID=UPI0014628533|nr:hypothetical protein [Acinetobacter baumannii]QJP36805.1 hypothetical protein G3R47_04400 [Acinetobacter baumannii]
MINALFVVAVLAFIVAAAFAFAYKVSGKEWKEKYWAENRLHLDTKNKLESKYHAALDEISKLEAQRFEQWERAEVLEQKNIDLKHELSERPLPKDDLEQPEEHGTYVVHRNLKAATPDLYRVVFELDVNGQRVLEDLTKRFSRHAFVSDSQGGERETCRRLGQSEPVNFILSQINKANDPNYSEVENNA